MESHPIVRKNSPTLPRPRVWQDIAAESLLGVAVAVIALTGVNSVVLSLNLWLASIIPAYDPMVTMLALVVVVIGGLILGSIRLKTSVRPVEEARVLQPAKPHRVRARGTIPYAGS
jgi:hypothetical protein